MNVVTHWSSAVRGLLSGEEVSLCGEVFLHNKPHSRRQRAGECDTPECRVMSLACLPLTPGPGHYLAAGCSDGLIRYLALDASLTQ